jgi:transcriptional regulator NrdR family protein
MGKISNHNMLICQSCKLDRSFVVDARANKDGFRRRRGYQNCGERYSTNEVVELMGR